MTQIERKIYRDRETGRQGDRETGRQGDRETKKEERETYIFSITFSSPTTPMVWPFVFLCGDYVQM